MISMSEAKHILVIETDYTTRVEIRGMLEALGHTVSTCAGRDESIDYLKKNPAPHLIILSTSFTLVSDGALLSTIQGDQKTALVPLARIATPDDSRPVNTCGILLRPVSKEALTSCIEKAFSKPAKTIIGKQ
jgi:CheY-like chemotaxis protein